MSVGDAIDADQRSEGGSSMSAKQLCLDPMKEIEGGDGIIINPKAARGG
jgi:hypothetical protein